MSLMWMPAHTTTPPGASARSAAGTRAPTGANTIAASSSSGAGPIASPAHSAPSSRANACEAVSSARVKANTRRPWCRATCATMWAGDQRQPRRGELAVDDVEVGPAHGARVDGDERLPATGCGLGGVSGRTQRAPGGVEDHGAHRRIIYPRNHGRAHRHLRPRTTP